MSIIKCIINSGTDKQLSPAANKHIRFTNSISLFVCFFIVQCAALAIYYDQPLLIWVYGLHFTGIAVIPFFNFLGKRVLASAWFSAVAILFVTFYAIVFTIESFNFIFLG